MGRTTLVWAIAAAVAADASVALAQSSKQDRTRIEELTGLKGTFIDAERVFKVTSPRTDVKVSVDGWSMPPFMGLTSWVSFGQTPSARTMIMGDLVLLQDEVNPVMSELLGAGLEVTALHNHFFFDEPKVYFMHVTGEGSLDAVAQGVRKAFDKVKELRAAGPPATHSGAPALPDASAITGKTVADILGVEGQANQGMYKVVIGRKASAACGCEVAKEMGVNTWAAFAGVDDNAVVDGDFVVLETELQGVLKALRKADIAIVAIHHHMTGETPRLLFLHYWGRGRVDALATGVKSALATQKE
jgi:hypothetical protein